MDAILDAEFDAVLDAELDSEMNPQELDTIEIVPNEDVDTNDAELTSDGSSYTKSDARTPVENEEPKHKIDIRATKMLFGVELPILEENIELPDYWSKIQKVPAFLRQNPNFARYCSPEMISFGPIHHRQQNGDLQLGQQFKYLWAFRYTKQFASEKGRPNIEDAKSFLHESVTQHLQELRNLFSKDVTRGYEDEELAQMLFVDGCALLYFMGKIVDQNPRLLMLKFDQLWCIWRDIILLENQLPSKLLKLLTGGSKSKLNRLLFRFLSMGLPMKKEDLAIFSRRYGEGNIPTHLLDYIRSYYSYEASRTKERVKFRRCPQICVRILPFSVLSLIKKVFRPFLNIKKAFGSLFPEADYWHRYKNIGDLKKAGIQVKLGQTDEWKWLNISFTSNLFRGQLMLPGTVINDITPYLYHNLIAYEMCPDFYHNFEFCSYFSLMDSLIDDAEDVKELRAAGVLQNLLGTDEDVAKLFNELGHVLPRKHLNDQRYSNKYDIVKDQIDEHYRSKGKTWLAQLRSTYFDTPWSYITFSAAVFVLVLTLLQTWYTIHPVK